MRSCPTFSLAAWIGSFCRLHRYFHLFLSTLLDVDFWSFYVIYIIDYSVKVSFRQDKFLLLVFLSFPRFRLFAATFLLHFEMSAHQTNKEKPRSIKCDHFCFFLIHTIIALPVGNLARVMTPVSRSNLPVKSVHLSQKNN